VHTIRLSYILLFVLLLPVAAFAQLKKYSPARTAPKKVLVNEQNTRRHAANPVTLPFWDDFSSVKGHSADSLLWINNNKVFINDGQGINPPSINVATFDGYNENGVPYSNAPLETGYGDTLESQPIKLKSVPIAQRNNIYLSFFYQPGGNSEMPNPSDFLKLEFKGKNGWVEIKRFYVKPNVDRTVFYDTAIQIPQTIVVNGPVNDTIFFQDDFQFRFTSFGRLSGAYDAWHLDYVYLNRRVNDDQEALDDFGNPTALPTSKVNEFDKNTNINDRTTTRPLSTIFTNGYWSMPRRHFNAKVHLVKPDVSLYSLKHVTFPFQAVNYSSYATITHYKDGAVTTSFDGTVDPLATPFEPQPEFQGIPILEHVTVQVKNLPDTSTFRANSDSTKIFFQVNFNSGDNLLDYYPRYTDIDFRTNDTLQHTFTLSNYYAYDDGVAEYSAGLAVQGNQLAYRFIMGDITQDTLNGAYIYFPYFGGTVPETMQLFVFKNDNGKPNINEFYSQTVPVSRTANNLFSEITFTEGVVVSDTFYIGYVETQTGAPDRIRIGLDASHNTGQHMFYRNTILHAWQQNTVVEGSLMIRPRFGEATVITDIEKPLKPVTIYPNPNKGEFYMKGVVDRIDRLQIITSTGQPVSFAIENFDDTKKITLRAAPGLYLVRYQSGAKVYTDKIIVTGN
jgi:hypothetical protein